MGVLAIRATRGELRDQHVVARARARGFGLVWFETDSGQLVWEWRRGSEPRPQFVTRRVALHWMTEWLAREGANGAPAPE